MSKILKFLNNPSLVMSSSLFIAVIVGYFGYQQLNQNPVSDFATTTSSVVQDINGLQNLNLNFQSSGQVNKISIKTGDQVKVGQILATLNPENTLGALTQARASLASATANYNKLINGATNADVNVTNASLLAAQVTLQHSQDSLNLALNNSLISVNTAVSNTDFLFDNPYSSNLNLKNNTGVSFTNQILQSKVENDRVTVNQTINSWKTNQNDTSAAKNNLQIVANYFSDLNNLFSQYSDGTQSIISSDESTINSAQSIITAQIAVVTNAIQAVSNAQSAIAQIQASLNLKTSSARPEDVAAAKAQMSNALGSVQIAESAYQNKILTTPVNGVVTAIYITVGENINANTVAVEIKVNNK